MTMIPSPNPIPPPRDASATGTSSFADLIQRLRAGEQSAPTEIFRRYSERLVSLAGQRIARCLRQKIDAEDVVQSAFLSFFRENRADQFRMASWNDLWSLLLTLTLRKCDGQLRRFTSLKRSINREKPLNLAESSALWEPIAREPTPAEAGALAETIESLLNRLEERDRTIAELTLQGCSSGQIAARVGLSERSVFRKLKSIRALIDEPPLDE
jgi:RNA polymerase sigma factor (sigma-70 family)